MNIIIIYSETTQVFGLLPFCCQIISYNLKQLIINHICVLTQGMSLNGKVSKICTESNILLNNFNCIHITGNLLRNTKFDKLLKSTKLTLWPE